MTTRLHDHIQIARTHLRNIGETLSKSTSLIDLVSIQLNLMHNEQQDIPGPFPSATLYQLQSMLELVDGQLMDLEISINELLGESAN